MSDDDDEEADEHGPGADDPHDGCVAEVADEGAGEHDQGQDQGPPGRADGVV